MKVNFSRYSNKFITGILIFQVQSLSCLEVIQSVALKNESFSGVDIFCKVSLVTSLTDDGAEIQRTFYSQSAIFVSNTLKEKILKYYESSSKSFYAYFYDRYKNELQHLTHVTPKQSSFVHCFLCNYVSGRTSNLQSDRFVLYLGELK